MPVEKMRSEIMLVYPGDKWKHRVKHMHPNQVIAIYRSFQRNGKFAGLRQAAGELIPPPPPSPYHQMTIEEWMKGE